MPIAAEPEVKVCAVVVAFHPPLELFRKVIDAVLPQVSDVVIVDNTSGNTRPIDVGSEKVHVIAFKENRGVGAAHNAGFEWAREHGSTHVLLLDHDSVPAADMVDQLVKATSELEKRGIPVGVVGPKYINTATRRSSFFVQFKAYGFKRVWCDAAERLTPVDFLISSGSLIPVRVLDQVGLMDEGLFVDHVDTDWCLRARTKGYQAFGVRAAVMEHTLGSNMIAVTFVKREVPEHSPIRHYYTFRNSLCLYRRSYAAPRWIAGDLLRLLGMMVFYPLVTPPRLEHLRMMVRGIRDGIRGKTGPYRPNPSGGR